MYVFDIIGKLNEGEFEDEMLGFKVGSTALLPCIIEENRALFARN